MDNLDKQLNKETLHDKDSKSILKVKEFDASSAYIESSGTISGKGNESNNIGNDTDVDGGDIRPFYDTELMAEAYISIIAMFVFKHFCRYEKELMHQIHNLLGGELACEMLVQVNMIQKLKLYIKMAMLDLNKILKVNEINFAILAALHHSFSPLACSCYCVHGSNIESKPSIVLENCGIANLAIQGGSGSRLGLCRTKVWGKRGGKKVGKGDAHSSLDKEKLKELTASDSTPSSSIPKPKQDHFKHYKNIICQMSRRYGYMFRHMKRSFMPRKEFCEMAARLKSTMKQVLPLMIDKRVNKILKNTMPLYVAEGLLLENEVIEMKSSHKAKIKELESWVEKLEEENMSLTKELKSVNIRVESQTIKETVMDKEESSKQGRKIGNINADAESKPNGKLIYNSIKHGPYVRRIIPKPGDPNREVPVAKTFHEQTDDELTEKEVKKMEADDQTI
nr:protein DGS1, mitochondrial [Tanacetum cinerariifolium]